MQKKNNILKGSVMAYQSQWQKVALVFVEDCKRKIWPSDFYWMTLIRPNDELRINYLDTKLTYAFKLIKLL